MGSFSTMKIAGLVLLTLVPHRVSSADAETIPETFEDLVKQIRKPQKVTSSFGYYRTAHCAQVIKHREACWEKLWNVIKNQMGLTYISGAQAKRKSRNGSPPSVT